MDQDGGVKLPPITPMKVPKIGIQSSVIRPRPSTSPPTTDRRNPPFPDGFQPTTIRNIVTEKSYDTPSDSFPEITVSEQLKELNKVESRRLVESGIGASEQCKVLMIEKNNCFLCGFSLDDPRIPFASQNDFGYSQCEHLLPAAAAVLVFGIIESKEEATRRPGNYRLNYAYAHSGCNREKGSRLFMSMRPAEFLSGRSPIYSDNIRKYLEDLYTFNPIIQSAVIASTGAGGKDAWISAQLEHITATYTPLSLELGRIDKLSLITGIAKYFENVDYLYSKLIKNNVSDKREYYRRGIAVEGLMKVGDVGGRKTFRRKHNGRSVRKTSVRRNGSASRTYRKVRTRARKRAH